jgi:hypothetical protein
MNEAEIIYNLHNQRQQICLGQMENPCVCVEKAQKGKMFRYTSCLYVSPTTAKKQVQFTYLDNIQEDKMYFAEVMYCSQQ